MFHRMSLRTKLTSVFLVFSVFLAVVGGVGFFSLQFMTNKYHRVAVETIPRTFATSELRAVVQTMSRVMAHLADPEYSKDDRTKMRKQIADRFERYEKALAKLESFSLSDGEKEVVAESHANWKVLRGLLEQGIKASELETPEGFARLQKLAGPELFAIMNKYNETAAKMRKVLDQEVETELASTDASARTGYLLTLCSVVFGIVASLILAISFSTSIGRRLQFVASSFSENVNHVNAQAQKMASSSEALSSAVTQQSATLQSTSSSIQEISEMVRLNAENSSRSNDLAVASETTARSSQKNVEDMLAAIEMINESNSRGFERVNESNHEFARIVKVITEIGEKTKVINDIVFQTKLLSFNASVEAARAGEHGKGFAVVAEEVGNLAAMSGNASKEISDMLGTGIASVNEIVANTRRQLDDLMRDSKSSVEKGISVAGRCRESLGHLVTNVAELQKMVSHISLASAEQSQAINDVTRSIRELDGVTDLNRNLASESSTSSVDLQDRSRLLEASLHDLHQTINGNEGFASAASVTTLSPSESSKDSGRRAA